MNLQKKPTHVGYLSRRHVLLSLQASPHAHPRAGSIPLLCEWGRAYRGAVALVAPVQGGSGGRAVLRGDEHQGAVLRGDEHQGATIH